RGFGAIKEILRGEEMVRVVRARPAEVDPRAVVIHRKRGADHRRTMSVAVHEILAEGVHACGAKELCHGHYWWSRPPERARRKGIAIGQQRKRVFEGNAAVRSAEVVRGHAVVGVRI